MGDYVLVSTTETDENGRPPNPGVINGGFYKKPADQQSHSTSLVIGVADIRVSMKKISESGGKLQGEPMEIPGKGTYVSFLDTKGNRMSILQPLPNM